MSKTAFNSRTKQRVNNEALRQGQTPESTLSVLLEVDEWDKALIQYHSRYNEIQASPRLTRQGKSEEVVVEQNKLLKQLAASESILEQIENNIQALDGAMTNDIVAALGDNRTLDPTAALVEYLKMQETRSLWMYQQPRAEEEHAKVLRGFQSMKIPVSDNERTPPNVIKDALMEASSSLKGDKGINENSRLIVNAVLKSPVPLLDSETITQAKELIKQNVCAEKLATRAAATCRADCLGIMFHGLEDQIRNPARIAVQQSDYVPVSDQDRQSAQN
jgi:hypothetical protein